MIYSSGDKECNRLKLVILGHFLPFHPPKNPQKNEKRKQLLEISSFYMCAKNHYNDVQFLRHRVRQTQPFVILGHCLPLYPPNDPKNQNFENMRKMHGEMTDRICHLGPFFALSPR